MSIHTVCLKFPRLKKATVLPFVAASIFALPSFAAANELEQLLALSDKGQHQQALSQFQQLTPAAQTAYDAQLIKATLEQNAGNTVAAKALLEALIKTAPKQPEAFNNLAVLYAQEGNYTRAIETLQAAMDTHPSYSTVQKNLKDIYATLASQAYNKALDIKQEQAVPALTLLADAPGSQPREAVIPRPVISEKPAAKPANEEVSKAETQTVAAVLAAEPQAETPITAEDTSGELQQIGTLLEQWSSAWSEQNPSAYVEAYTSTYRPSPELSHSDWVKQRHVRLTKPKFIKVAISEIDISLLRDNLAEVYFEQRYESDSFKDAVRKRLLLVKENTQWRISHERSLSYID